MAPHNHMVSRKLNFCERDAQEEFPGDTPELAVQKYAYKHQVKGIFFRDSGGRRCVWAPEVTMLRFRVPGSFDYGPDGRKYLFQKKEPALKVVDRPRPFQFQYATRHTSFNGWNLPEDHPRHFLKLPQEVQNLIFELALTVPQPSLVLPQTIHSNWKTEFRETTYHRFKNRGYYCCEELFTPRHLSLVQHWDAYGPYTEMRLVPRNDIDSTFLRASRYLYNFGNEILYSKNEFYFPMLNSYLHHSPPTLLPVGQIHRPVPIYKPEFTTAEEFLPAFDGIELQIPYTLLPGWIYYDHFLRFLHTIGPKNAALIKSVRFQGVVKLHPRCQDELCTKEGCDEDLVVSLDHYIPFIRRFCTSLQKLSIHAFRDKIFGRQVWITNPGSPLTREEAFTKLLEKLKSIDSLKQLEILGDSEDDDGMGFVEETVQWIADRATQRKRDERGLCSGTVSD